MNPRRLAILVVCAMTIGCGTNAARQIQCENERENASTTIAFLPLAPDEFSGNFEIELPICEDAETGQSLGWPPKPFILRGSFDRLPLANHLD